MDWLKYLAWFPEVLGLLQKHNLKLIDVIGFVVDVIDLLKARGVIESS